MANTEFQKICEFFCVNRLVLHPDKTKFILFTRSKIKQLNLINLPSLDLCKFGYEGSQVHRAPVADIVKFSIQAK